jgi:glutamate decarboxylase
MKKGRYVVDPDDVMERVDENTIGVVPILGTTYTGEFEPIREVHDRVVAFNEAKGLDIPIHVDAASGGFVAPFIHPELEWDFRLPQVKSINVSGHKYGLTYPGIGFVVWRSEDELPKDLIFHVNYLGGDMPTFTLNFSRPGNQVIGQYYNFIRLGRNGYTRIMETLRDIAVQISSGIANTGPFEVVSDGTAIPVVSFKLKDDIDSYTVFHISEQLRTHGWQVPAYTMPEDATDVAVLRIVVREGFDMDLADSLLEDLAGAVAHFEQFPPPHPNPDSGFAH